MKKISFHLIVLFTILYSCHEPHNKKVRHIPMNHHHKPDHDHGHSHDHGHANHHMNETPFHELVERFESDERTEYQKPEEVIHSLGNLSGLKVMDLGAGTGYFSFRLAEAGARVIAADVDDRFLDYIKKKKKSLNLSDSIVELRKVPYNSPELVEYEVDVVLIVNTYHHIENRSEYFKKVKTGLKDDGRLVVIDFQKIELPVGPPLEMKLSPSEVESELDLAGFKEFSVDSTLLPYQCILIDPSI